MEITTEKIREHEDLPSDHFMTKQINRAIKEGGVRMGVRSKILFHDKRPPILRAMSASGKIFNRQCRVVEITVREVMCNKTWELSFILIADDGFKTIRLYEKDPCLKTRGL